MTQSEERYATWIIASRCPSCSRANIFTEHNACERIQFRVPPFGYPRNKRRFMVRCHSRQCGRLYCIASPPGFVVTRIVNKQDRERKRQERKIHKIRLTAKQALEVLDKKGHDHAKINTQKMANQMYV